MSGSAEDGDFMYIGTTEASAIDIFGFAPTFTLHSMLFNGNDALALHKGAGMNSLSVVHIFGDPNLSGTNQPWDDTDDWVSRKSW